MSLAPGTAFGSYEVVESIGAGGMGEVYRATDTKLKRDVALKVLPQAFVQDADRLSRFQREAEILASLNHPNIAQVFGLETVDGQTAIVMELVEGPTVADRIKDGPLPVDEAMGIAVQVIAALETAHQRHIVHRDLKPANIKVREDGTVKVLDFGISKPLDPAAISGGSPVMTTPAVTQTGVILGTAAYMSPEQARGKFVDERTDIWAFGCLLFEMLTGQPVFGGEDVMLTLARVLDRDADLKSIPKTISPAVRHTIKLCLEKDPNRRIADIRDVRHALNGAFETELPRGTPTEQSALPRRVMPIAAAAAIAALIAGFIGWSLKPAPAPMPELATRFVIELPVGLDFNDIANQPIAVSAAGDLIAYAAGGAVYLRPIDELDAQILPRTEGDTPRQLMFSPDGQWIAYYSPIDRRLKKIRVDGSGAPVVLGTYTENIPLVSAWTGDGRILYSHAGVGVFALSADGGEPEMIAEGNFFGATLLPGGDQLLGIRQISDGNFVVFVRSLETGETKELFPGIRPRYLDSGHILYFFEDGGLQVRSFDPVTLAFGGAVSVEDGVERVSVNAAPAFVVSASGTLAYIEGQGRGDATAVGLAILDSRGRLVRNLEGLLPRDYRNPSVSPDGSRVALQVNSSDGRADIYVYDLDGQSEIRRLTYDGMLNQDPAWWDDERIAFASDRGDGKQRIWRQGADGGSLEPLTEPAEGRSQFMPLRAPDDRLVFAEGNALDASGNSVDVFVTVPGGEPEPLVTGDALQVVTAFSPDGTMLAYTSVIANGAGIFVQPYPPDNRKVRIAETMQAALLPFWLVDESGAHLMFMNPVDRSISAVDIDGFSFSAPGVVTHYAGNNSARNADAIPGTGNMVVTWAGDPGTATGGRSTRRIVVAQHWTETLRERFGDR